MRRFSDQPESLGDVLRVVARRVKKVDLTVIDEVRELWPHVVDEKLATTCQPEFVKNRVNGFVIDIERETKPEKMIYLVR